MITLTSLYLGVKVKKSFICFF